MVTGSWKKRTRSKGSELLVGHVCRSDRCDLFEPSSGWNGETGKSDEAIDQDGTVSPFYGKLYSQNGVVRDDEDGEMSLRRS